MLHGWFRRYGTGRRWQTDNGVLLIGEPHSSDLSGITEHFAERGVAQFHGHRQFLFLFGGAPKHKIGGDFATTEFLGFLCDILNHGAKGGVVEFDAGYDQRGKLRQRILLRSGILLRGGTVREPFAGVDPIAVEDIQNIVAHLKDRNIGILITDHNVHETLSITDRAYLLFEGDILKAGTAEELAEDPEVRKVYLGQNFELRK